ncbi:MAG: DMT family protein [Thermoguttaceae bacterium]|nr:DMT family protein [Thermoguttaceae bacterium]
MKIFLTVFMLICSNAFQTYAWYGHLSTMKGKCWFLAAVVSWGIAFFEYMIMVPANRVGSEAMSLSQLKILQEAITLSVFVPYAIFIARQRVGWNYLWAGLCVAAAIFFIFHDPGAKPMTPDAEDAVAVQNVDETLANETAVKDEAVK